MKLTTLAPGETTRLRDLRLRALRDAPDAFGSSAEETAARPAESWVQQLRDLPTWVAVVDEIDLGMVRGAPDKDDPTVAWLISMWVAPEGRGRGVGDALVQAVIDWARAAGFAELRLDVGDHNAPAIALYARKGFQPTGNTGALAPPRSHITEHERAIQLMDKTGAGDQWH